jgi:hypothetical protein
MLRIIVSGVEKRIEHESKNPAWHVLALGMIDIEVVHGVFHQ